MSLQVKTWYHYCDKAKLSPEFFEDNGDVIDLDDVVGDDNSDAICDAVDWTMRGNGREGRLGGGYLKFCPYCGEPLPQTPKEARAYYIRQSEES